jgi:hypothetical protein
VQPAGRGDDGIAAEDDISDEPVVHGVGDEVIARAEGGDKIRHLRRAIVGDRDFVEGDDIGIEV